MKYPMRVMLALSLTVLGGLVAQGAGAAPSALVKVVRSPAYNFDNVTALVSNGDHVWAANTSNNSVTELKSGSGELINVLKDKKFDFEGLVAARQPGFADVSTDAEKKKRYDLCQRALDELADIVVVLSDQDTRHRPSFRWDWAKWARRRRKRAG